MRPTHAHVSTLNLAGRENRTSTSDGRRGKREQRPFGVHLFRVPRRFNGDVCMN